MDVLESRSGPEGWSDWRRFPIQIENGSSGRAEEEVPADRRRPESLQTVTGDDDHTDGRSYWRFARKRSGAISEGAVDRDGGRWS